MNKLDSLKSLVENLRGHEGVVTGYAHHLVRNPERIDAILLFLIWTFFVEVVILMYRKEIIKGLEGKNLLFEGAEIVTFVTVLCLPPTLFYMLFFKDTQPNQKFALMFEGGLIATCLYGRYIFDWALAFKSGADHVNLTPETKKTESLSTTVVNTATVVEEVK